MRNSDRNTPSPPEPDGSYGTPPWRGENRKGTGSGVCIFDGTPGDPSVGQDAVSPF